MTINKFSLLKSERWEEPYWMLQTKRSKRQQESSSNRNYPPTQCSASWVQRLIKIHTTDVVIVKTEIQKPSLPTTSILYLQGTAVDMLFLPVILRISSIYCSFFTESKHIGGNRV